MTQEARTACTDFAGLAKRIALVNRKVISLRNLMENDPGNTGELAGGVLGDISIMLRECSDEAQKCASVHSPPSSEDEAANERAYDGA